MAHTGFRMDWRGDRFSDRAYNASRTAIDQTTQSCVPLAKAETPVITGTAQGSIRTEDARIFRRQHIVEGRWGSFDVNYFIWLEIGGRGRTGIFMLRRAADREYPRLRDRIRIAYARAR